MIKPKESDLTLRCEKHPCNFFKVHDIHKHKCGDPECESLELRLAKMLRHIDSRKRDDWALKYREQKQEDYDNLKKLQAMLTEQHSFASQKCRNSCMQTDKA